MALNPDIAGALAMLATLVVGLSIAYFVNRRKKAKKRTLEDNVVGSEVFQLEAGGIIAALPVQLFDEDDVVSLTINKVVGNLVAKVHAACKKGRASKETPAGDHQFDRR